MQNYRVIFVKLINDSMEIEIIRADNELDAVKRHRAISEYDVSKLTTLEDVYLKIFKDNAFVICEEIKKQRAS